MTHPLSEDATANALPNLHIPSSSSDSYSASPTSSITSSPAGSPQRGGTPNVITKEVPPSSSPTAALESLDLDLDFSSLSAFDLVGSDWTSLLSLAFRAQRSKIEETPVGRHVKSRLLAAQQRLIHTQLRIMSNQRTPAAVKNRDKFAFVLGVTNMWVTAVLLGMLPTALPAFYILKIAILLPTRLVLYRRKRFHYFMFDMCYYVNALLILLILLPGAHSNLFCATWGLSTGPVLIAIAAWKNSLVFHSLDKLTSLLIHFDPPLTLFALRWVVNKNTTTPSWIFPPHLLALSSDPPDVSFMQLTAVSLAMYLFWQAVYWTFVWTMRADKIASGYATSTTWMLGNPKSAMSKAVKRVPKAYQPAMFMFIQWLYTVLTVSVTYAFYHYKYLHGAALVISLGFATWNGANYYFEVFSRRYIEELVALEKELEGVGRKDAAARAEDKKDGVVPEQQPLVNGVLTPKEKDI
ncbi:hypothetical protein DFJ77DRAFT_447345 [Powellomyces hirtus]|nr:hypothetical protein DFJ77DRAFT_447345 [Powellomyces hirtus]